MFLSASKFLTSFEWSNNDKFVHGVYFMETDIEADIYMRNIPMIRVNFGFDINFSKFHLYASMNYGSESGSNSRIGMEKRIFAEIPPYLQSSFCLTYHFNKKIKFLLSGNNIGNIKKLF